MDCNQMKMREALEAAHEFVYTACRQNIDVMVKDKNGERVVKSKDVLYKIYSALSAPPRNCDVVPVEAPEAADVFHSERPGHGYDYETHDWLLAPAAERKGQGDYIDDVLCRLRKYEELLKKSYVAFCDACGRICGEFAMKNNIKRKQWAHELADEIWAAINTSPAEDRKGERNDYL